MFRRRRRDDLNHEIRVHLDMAAHERIERGEAPDEARAHARREFGNVALVAELVREMWGWGSLDRLWHDVRYGLRLLGRSPAFAGVALLCLALGVGVTTTMFSAVNGLLLRPLPYHDADRLAVIHTRDVKSERSDSGAVSWADFVVWRRANRTFSDMGVWSYGPAALSSPGVEPTPVVIAQISPGVLRALGVSPVTGRDFDERDQQFGNHFVAIMSHSLWTGRYGGRRDIVGQSIEIERRPVPIRSYVVVGVLPAGMTFPEGVDLFLPMQVDADEYDRHDTRFGRGAIGRLKAHVTLAQARADIVALSRRLQQEFPKTNLNREAEVVPLRDDLVGSRRTPILLFQGAAILVLLIACANVATLMLARAAVRQRELAVRSAIGASRARVVRQLVTESLVLAFGGGALGILLATGGTRMLVLLLPEGLPTYTDLSLDGTVLVFTIALSAVTGLLFGLAPSLRSSRVGPGTLREDGRYTGTAGLPSRLRGGLVAAQVAISLVLVIGATLVLRSNRLIESELGFDRNVLWVSIPTPADRYEGAPREVFFEDLVTRIRSISGVASVGRAAASPPLGPAASRRMRIEIEGQVTIPGARPEAIVSEIDPSYLSTIGVPILRGRVFDESDRPADAGARQFSAIVNQTFARMYLPGQDPIGRRVKAELPGAGSLGNLTFTIVGLSRDFRQERPPQPIAPAMYVYVPLGSNNTPLVVRATANPDAIIRDVRVIVRQMDPALRIAVNQTFEEAVSRGLAQERLHQRVLGIFALVALGMAMIGLYGVMSYVVAQRMHEFGVRVALGAAPRQLLRLVLGQGMRPAAIGLALGVIAALALTRLLAGVLYGIRPTDPATFIGVSLVLGAIAILAGLIPARRAARVDPIVTLRAE